MSNRVKSNVCNMARNLGKRKYIHVHIKNTSKQVLGQESEDELPAFPVSILLFRWAATADCSLTGLSPVRLTDTGNKNEVIYSPILPQLFKQMSNFKQIPSAAEWQIPVHTQTSPADAECILSTPPGLPSLHPASC